MAKPSDKLAESLEVLHQLQKRGVVPFANFLAQLVEAGWEGKASLERLSL